MSMSIRNIRLAASALALIAAASVATAVHAQVIINQETALAGTGPWDPPGFPVTINTRGSYQLTSNLEVPAGASGIEVKTEGVTIDLNGFSVRTTGVCVVDTAAHTASCTGGFGVTGVEFKFAGNTLRNGRVKGFAVGISFKGADLLENLLVEHNHTGLISPSYTGAHTLIRGVRAEQNRVDGFDVRAVQIVDSSAGRNGGNGFTCQDGLLLDSTAMDNSGKGMVGYDCAVGRSWANRNFGGNIVMVKSLGGNLSGFAPY